MSKWSLIYIYKKYRILGEQNRATWTWRLDIDGTTHAAILNLIGQMPAYLIGWHGEFLTEVTKLTATLSSEEKQAVRATPLHAPWTWHCHTSGVERSIRAGY